MRSLLIVCVLLAGAAAATADTIRVAGGKNVTGRVVSYANLVFDVEVEGGRILKLPASSVISIDFERGSVNATLETRAAGKLQRKLLLYDRGAFAVEDDRGVVHRLPAMMVNSASFGAAFSGRTVESVSGSDLTKHIVTGKVTIVDFYADWCAPCRKIGPVLENIAKKDAEVVLRKVNIDSNQALAREYKVRGIPHIMIYDKSGKNIATIVGADQPGIERAIARAKAGSS